MANKNLLNEGTVRRWGRLSNNTPLVESFIEERAEQFTEGEETLEEDNFDKTGVGPHREGAHKDGEQKGIASNQGKEPKDTPDGKLEIPGTGYAGDHANKNKSPDKGSTDGGTQLQGQGNVTENKLNEMPMPGEEDPMADDGMGADMGATPPAPEMDAEMGGDEYGAGGLEGLVAAIAAAISDSTGVQVTVAGGAEGAEPMGDMPPAGDDMGADVDMPPAGDDMGGGDDMAPSMDDEEEVVENQINLSEVDDAAFQQEAMNRGYKRQDEQVQENQEDIVESIARKVATRLATKRKPAKRASKK